MNQRLEESPPKKELLTLSELKEKAKQTDIDEISARLIDVFSVSELDSYSPFLSEADQEAQNEIRNIVIDARQKFNTERTKRELEAQELRRLIDQVPYTESQLGLRNPALVDLLRQFQALRQLVEEVISVDSFNKQEITRESLSNLAHFFDSYGVEYDEELFAVYASSYSDLTGRQKLQKVGQQVFKSRKYTVESQIYTAISQLTKKMGVQIESRITETLAKTQEVISHLQEEAESAQDITFLDISSELRALCTSVKNTEVPTMKLVVPETYFQLVQEVEKMVVDAQRQVVKAQEIRLENIEDLSPAALTELDRIQERIESTPVLLLQTRESVLSFLHELREYSSQNVTLEARITSLKRLVEEKQVMHTLVRDPANLKRKLYEAYLQFPGDSARKKAFLREGVHLLRELVDQQTDAFLNGYSDTLQQFEAVGLHPIEMNQLAIQQTFFRNGYEVMAQYKEDFIDALVRTKDSHNQLISVLSEYFNLEETSSAELGKQVYTAFLLGKGIRSDSLPYGTVRLDVTSPITSIRLVCEDGRDYSYAAGDLAYSEYETIQKHKTSSGGVSWPLEQPFVMTSKSGKTESKYLPLTVVNGTVEDSYQQTVVIHEDAHQAIIVESSDKKSDVSAQEREKQIRFHDVFEPMITDSYKQGELINTWREGLIVQMNNAIKGMRDETQAYLTDTRPVEKIRSLLAESGPDALYEYVGSYEYRMQFVKHIEEAVTDPQMQKELLSFFVADVQLVKELYRKKRADFLDQVDRIVTLFYVHDVEREQAARTLSATEYSECFDHARKKVALLVRNMTIDEFKSATRYLQSSQRLNPDKKPIAGGEHRATRLNRVLERISDMSDDWFVALNKEAPTAIRFFAQIAVEIIAVAPEYMKQNTQGMNAFEGIDDISTASPALLQQAITLLFKLNSSAFSWNKEQQKELEAFEAERTAIVMKHQSATMSFDIAGASVLTALKNIYLETNSRR